MRKFKLSDFEGHPVRGFVAEDGTPPQSVDEHVEKIIDAAEASLNQPSLTMHVFLNRILSREGVRCGVIIKNKHATQ
jgi:hypothetical protein